MIKMQVYPTYPIWSNFVFTCKVCKDKCGFSAQSEFPHTEELNQTEYPYTTKFDNGLEIAYCDNCGVIIQLQQIKKWITLKPKESNDTEIKEIVKNDEQTD